MNAPGRNFKNPLIGEATRWLRRFTETTDESLCQTIEEFNKFAVAYLDYFKYDETAKAEPTAWLEERIKNTLLEYWMPLYSIAAQYYLPEYKERLQTVIENQLPEFISKAENLNVQIGNVLLYINKFPNSYFYPYTTRSFIALSWLDEQATARPNLLDDDDIMALPHEIGHHVYCNNDFGNPGDVFHSRLTLPDVIWKELPEKTGMPPEKMELVTSVIKNWTEEIFADVLGTLISGNGELFADSAQRLMDRFCQNEDDMLFDDGRHPLAYLRPLISARTLEHQSVSTKKWDQFVRKLRIAPHSLEVMTPQAGTAEIKIDHLKCALELAVDYIYENIIYKKGQAGDLVPRGLPLSTTRITNFSELINFIEKKYSPDKKEINNTLLVPLAYERDYVSWWCSTCGRITQFKCSNCGK